MELNREEQIKQNKIMFYTIASAMFFVSFFGIILGIFFIIDNSTFYVGYFVLFFGICLIIISVLFLKNKPDFLPYTLKKTTILNKSPKDISHIIFNWFDINKFEVTKNNDNIIGTKEINNRVKYVFETKLTRKEENCKFQGRFYIIFDYNSRIIDPTTTSLSKKYCLGFLYTHPAWDLMEDLMKNIQSN